MTEIIERAATDAIGEYRFPRDLGRGDHVRLDDGRWALLNTKPVGGDVGRLMAEVVIDMTRYEQASWIAAQRVFSRTPDEHMRAVTEAFADIKVDATAAAILRREIGLAP